MTSNHPDGLRPFLSQRYINDRQAWRGSQIQGSVRCVCVCVKVNRRRRSDHWQKRRRSSSEAEAENGPVTPTIWTFLQPFRSVFCIHCSSISSHKTKQFLFGQSERNKYRNSPSAEWLRVCAPSPSSPSLNQSPADPAESQKTKKRMFSVLIKNRASRVT